MFASVLALLVLCLCMYTSARSNWSVNKITQRSQNAIRAKSLIVPSIQDNDLRKYIKYFCDDILRILPTITERINDKLSQLEYEVDIGEYDYIIDKDEILFLLLELRKYYLPYGNILMIDSFIENIPITMKRYIVKV